MSDKLIKDILAKYDEDFASNTWLVPGGKARAIMHKCIERMIVRAGITFDLPQMVVSDPEQCVMIVTGHMGDRSEWSVGEASPKNNKNAYPYSMAEKRGKDRVALKLIGLHGLLYSEEEADDFKQQPAAPQQTAPTPTTNPAFWRIRSRLEAEGSNVDVILQEEGATITALPEDLKERLRGVVRFVREARKVAA